MLTISLKQGILTVSDIISIMEVSLAHQSAKVWIQTQERAETRNREVSCIAVKARDTS